MPPGVADQSAPPQSPRRGILLLPQSPLRIKQDGKFYERLLSKENSSGGNLSFRYYWADQPGSVPFVWETQPGTPKDVARMVDVGALPAITPPPSYLLRHGTTSKVVAAASHRQQSKKKGRKKGCRLKRIKIVGFIAGIFRRLSLVRACRRSKVSSSSRWLFSSVVATTTEKGKHDDHHENETAAPARPHETNFMCGRSFWRVRPSPWLPRFRGGDGNRGG